MKLRILLPMAGALLVLLAVFAFAFRQEQQQRATRDMNRYSYEVQRLLRTEQLKKTAMMVTTLRAVLNDRLLVEAFEQGDREELMARTAPLHQSLKQEHKISHFYFHTTNRVNLLRVHRPDQKGDAINRFTIKEAERTGEIASGIERGPIGTFVLRVVSPWRQDGRLLGYVELGMEFEDLIKDLHGLLDVDFIAAVDKKFLDREQWNKALKTYGREASWDQFPETVVMDKTVAAIPAPVVKHLSSPRKEAGRSADRIDTSKGRATQLVFLPLRDVTGKLLGELIVLRDITASVQLARNSILLVATTCLVVGGLLFTCFYLHLSNVERNLTERRAKLRAEIAERQRAEEQLREAHEGLERRVQERTAELQQANERLSAEMETRERAQCELESTHRRLVETSRLAGMAEVATGVLHDVGNVLNSVNVSATIVSDHLKRSKAASLAKTAALLREHEHTLSAFITGDPRGRKLPGYLAKLAEHFVTEQDVLCKELDSLKTNVEHINRIVAMQQNYAKVSGVAEIVDARELMEDALRINAAGLDRHRVQVLREFPDLAPVPLERHKTLQILVNLIANAKHACSECGREDRRIVVRIAQLDNTVQFVVSDNGVGIAPEIVDRIFNHGFTTRKDGHGFGLHHGALSASEMGGSLTMHSDGPGKGATFTLSLPIERSQAPGGERPFAALSTRAERIDSAPFLESPQP